MGKDSGGGSQSQTVTQKPADFIAKYYSQAAKASQGLYNQGGPEYFPGSTYVPFSPETEMSLQAQTQRAMQGNPAVNQAQDYAQQVIRGDFLTGSPQLQQELSKIQGQVGSQFARTGGYRGSANQEVLAREMGDAAVRNYATERGLQQQAAFSSPTLAAQDYADIGALGDVGAKREDLFGRQLQDQMNRFNYQQQQPGETLDQYISRITALGGGMASQTTTSPTLGRSVLGGAMSGAQAGIGLGSAMGAASLGPWGIGGALLGGLFG